MKFSRAFTLIELMSVMVILGILLTLLAPAVYAVKRQTTLAASSSALRQLSTAAQTYLAENNGRFFRCLESSNGNDQWWFGFESSSSKTRGEGKRILDKSRSPLGPYIADSAGTVPDFAFTSMGSSFKPKYKNGYFGFGVNTELTGGAFGNTTNIPLLFNQISRPGQTVLFATCAQINTFQAPASAKKPMLEEFYMFNTKSSEAKVAIHFRHSGRALVAYADGSQGEIVGDPATFDKKLPKACVGALPPSMIVP
jgi:prepilin-type N-terminal cleavage/methylation domain-containing protein/prepilin-type processing-associated H-X9-DG protein